MFDTLWEIIGYSTGRVVVPLFSLGRIRVQPYFDTADVTFGWHGLRRADDGSLEMSTVTAELAGVLFWVAIVILGLAIYVWS